MQRWLTLILMLLTAFLVGCSKPSDAPSQEFMDSKLIVRAGVDDLGNVTVKEFVSVLKRVQKPDGSTADLLGWQKTDAGYTLRTRVATEFDLNFHWSKAEKLALLENASMDNGESVPGLQFFMLVASMPKVKADGDTAGSKPVASGSPGTTASARTTTSAAIQVATERRNVIASKLQGIECNDYCQLQYLNTAGVSQTAICADAEQCKTWAKEPKSFAAFVSTQAELTMEKKFIPEGNMTVDSVVAINVAKSTMSVVPAKTSEPTVSAAGSSSSPGSPLCKAGESTAFACSTGKKNIALCAVGSTQSGGVQLAYRIASMGHSSPEMIYPEPSTAARMAFISGSQSFMGDKSMAFINFDKGDYRYVIYSAEGKGLDKAGVSVEQGGKKIANLACSTAVSGDWSTTDGAGLPNDPRGFLLP